MSGSSAPLWHCSRRWFLPADDRSWCSLGTGRRRPGSRNTYAATGHLELRTAYWRILSADVPHTIYPLYTSTITDAYESQMLWEMPLILLGEVEMFRLYHIRFEQISWWWGSRNPSALSMVAKKAALPAALSCISYASSPQISWKFNLPAISERITGSGQLNIQLCLRAQIQDMLESCRLFFWCPLCGYRSTKAWGRTSEFFQCKNDLWWSLVTSILTLAKTTEVLSQWFLTRLRVFFFRFSLQPLGTDIDDLEPHPPSGGGKSRGPSGCR